MEATTRALAHFVVQARFDEVPEAARHEARRSLVNWLTHWSRNAGPSRRWLMSPRSRAWRFRTPSRSPF